MPDCRRSDTLQKSGLSCFFCKDNSKVKTGENNIPRICVRKYFGSNVMKLSEFIAKIIPWINGLPHPGVKKSHERGFFHMFNNKVKNLLKTMVSGKYLGYFSFIHSTVCMCLCCVCVCVYMIECLLHVCFFEIEINYFFKKSIFVYFLE